MTVIDVADVRAACLYDLAPVPDTLILVPVEPTAWGAVRADEIPLPAGWCTEDRRS